MSDSDSDLDFESADEDTTENDSSEKGNVSEIKELPKSSEVIESQHEADNSPKFTKESQHETGNINKTLNMSQQGTDNLDKYSKETDSSPKSANETKNSDIKMSPDSKESGSTKLIEKNDVSETELVSTLHELEISNDEAKPKKETQRVPLRLEKKIKQRDQVSKESSIEKTDLKENPANVEESNISSANDIPKVKSSWGFSSWGTSFLSTAASSVSTFSSQVSQGIGTVLESVESTLGAPSPEELASVLKERKDQGCEEVNIEEENNEEKNSGILPDVSSWAKVFENTGSKVIMGGLDTLELIGKKTIDILSEADPGLMSTRQVFSEKTNLSQILREAKELADKNESSNEQDKDLVNYTQVFDDQQGLVHLEALEILSKQTQAKFQRLLMRHSKKTEIKKRLEEIKSICENIPLSDDPSECEGFEDFESVFRKHVLELSIPVNVDNIVKTQRQLNETIASYENISKESSITPAEIYKSSICCLAEFTARCIETFHKVAELILVQSNSGSNIEQCSTNLTGLTTVMCIETNNLSSKYHKCLDASAEHFPDYINSQGLNITGMITNLYVEASNSNKYIQDAFQMIIPVLQVSLLESLEE